MKVNFKQANARPKVAKKTIPKAQIARDIRSLRRTLRIERDGLKKLADTLGDTFTHALEALYQTKDRIIVTGMGKSGHIARKVAATLASTGTPAQFVHPAEAGHGDLGMITPKDSVLALSWSGESPELRPILHYTRRFSIPLIAITSAPRSALARHADTVLLLPKATEACPHGLAPTTSTIMQMSLGDALSLALLERRGFSPQDFKLLHPGGKLGATLRTVEQLMHPKKELPLVSEGTSMRVALTVMSKKGFGCVGITNKKTEALMGIITDGDLRRHMGTKGIYERKVEDIMTHNPKTMPPDTLAGIALKQLNDKKVQCLFIVERKKPVGLVHFHDFLTDGLT